MALVDYSYDHKQHEEEEEEEEYIDMEVSSSSSSFTHLSPPNNPIREFEFQMSTINNVERESTTSPADELFYKGKLLPLHLPPRLQMVEKILHDSSIFNKFDEFYSTPLCTNTPTTPTTVTPFESCNVSPVESCQISRELNPEEYKGLFISDDNPKKSWTKKFKIKIKSLFGKSGCSDTKNKEGAKKIPFGQIPVPVVCHQERFQGENEVKVGNICHRRSFSGAFKRRSSIIKLSSSSSSGSSSSSSSSSRDSSNSNGLHDLQVVKRSNSSNSEIESSLIQGAIAHCKQSQQGLRSRKTSSEVGFHSLSSSMFSSLDDQTVLR